MNKLNSDKHADTSVLNKNSENQSFKLLNIGTLVYNNTDNQTATCADMHTDKNAHMYASHTCMNTYPCSTATIYKSGNTNMPDEALKYEYSNVLDAMPKTEYSDIPVYIFDRVTSTNQIARDLIEEHMHGNPKKSSDCFDNMNSEHSVSRHISESADANDRCSIPHGTVIIADSQSAGRGRLGRSFDSPSGSGLYMSIILRPYNMLKPHSKNYGQALASSHTHNTAQQSCQTSSAQDNARSLTCHADNPSGTNDTTANAFDPALITIAAAVAVVRALQAICGINADIKWINDILINEKKLCGILAEGIADATSGALDAVILGIGINLAAPECGYPPELADIVTTVIDAWNSERKIQAPRACEPDNASSAAYIGKSYLTALRNRLAAEIAINVIEILAQSCSIPLKAKVNADTSMLIDEYKSHCSTIGKDIFVYKHGLAGEAIPAKAIDIDQNGGLIVEYALSTDPSYSDDTAVSSFNASPCKQANIPKTEALTFGEISVRPQKPFDLTGQR